MERSGIIRRIIIYGIFLGAGIYMLIYPGIQSPPGQKILDRISVLISNPNPISIVCLVVFFVLPIIGLIKEFRKVLGRD